MSEALDERRWNPGSNPSPRNSNPAAKAHGPEDSPPVTRPTDGSRVKAALRAGTRARPRGFRSNPPQKTRKG